MIELGRLGYPVMPRRHSATAHEADAAQLAAMGHKAELDRNFSTLSMMGLAFAILNSWTALAASLSVALPSGGSTSVLWGLITAGICNLCLAVSLSEYLSAYPTAGGQYHWVAVISWKRYVPILSWITGWINVAGWIALVASGGLLGSQLIVGIISLTHPNYSPERWHQFLLYIAYNIIALVINAFMTSLLPLITKSAFIWSILGFVVISITVLATASPEYNSAEFVFTNFLNTTGWPDGIAWLLGLLQAAGAICLLVFPLVCLLFATISITTTSTRMTYAFARDGGLPFSRVFSKVHPKLGLPLNALWLTMTCVLLFGLIFLGSSSAFNAIVSASVVALGVSYAIPVAVGCLRGRKVLPEDRKFKLGAVAGWTCNLIGIAYVIVTTVLFLFPPDLPVTGSNMNYCVVAFFLVFVIAVVQWFVDGKKNFTGPRVDLDAIGEGHVVGIPVEGGEGTYEEGATRKVSGSDGSGKGL
ncbi:GABA permease protein [Rutstroemia sp. NJR-2017a BVV2]|nr:GABA permease protein [Rutstroemia sp. NJR-2017a BVV2]